MVRSNVIPIIDFARLKSACSDCNLRELCLPAGLSSEDIDRLDDLVSLRRPLRKNEYLYRAGDRFEALYAVRSGFFKTCLLSADGRDQVTGFQMIGELIGMDGISSDRHPCDAIALEDSEVCIIPFARLEELSRSVPGLQNHFHRVMSREIVRDQDVMMLLGSMRADERVAAFLLNLSQRLIARGYSAAEFHLRMTREEIGSYLGLKLETVSRIFSRFQDAGLVAVRQKNIRILDNAGLRSVIGQGDEA